jgi:hypothetical protein
MWFFQVTVASHAIPEARRLPQRSVSARDWSTVEWSQGTRPGATSRPLSRCAAAAAQQGA